jgi:hypothetical protein
MRGIPFGSAQGRRGKPGLRMTWARWGRAFATADTESAHGDGEKRGFAQTGLSVPRLMRGLRHGHERLGFR